MKNIYHRLRDNKLKITMFNYLIAGEQILLNKVKMFRQELSVSLLKFS